MTKPKMFEKPAGVKDYLPEAAERLRQVETRVLDCMRRWGYREIITPTLEFYDTVGAASSTSDAKLFKLLDKRGVTMVLRSDLTAPIARVVASLLRDAPLPLRLSYHANVFRAMEEGAGRDAEFYQTGVELVGDGTPEADAEVIALAVACLKAAGVDRFLIALGHVGFLNGLFRETLRDCPEEAEHELKDCLLRRDHVGYRQRLRELPLSAEAKGDLEGLLRLRGGKEICSQARPFTRDPLGFSSLDHLCRVFEALEDYGVSEHVRIDLTMIGDFSYYTGVYFEGYAADLGFPVASGGRYDNLLRQFGRPAPATGFALKTDRILEVVGGRILERTRRALVLFDTAGRKAALQYAAQLRNHGGWAVETRFLPEDETLEVAPERLAARNGERDAADERFAPDAAAQSGGPERIRLPDVTAGGTRAGACLVQGVRYDEVIVFAEEGKAWRKR